MLPDAENDAALREFDAIVSLVRFADSQKIIRWNLDKWRPVATEPDSVRLTVHVTRELDEAVRRMAFERRLTLSALVEQVLGGEVAEFEAKHGPIQPRIETKKEAEPAA